MPLEQIEENERRDPLLAFTDLLLTTGAISKDGILALYRDTDARLRRAADEAATRKKLTTVAQITAPLIRPTAGQCEVQVASNERRLEVFGGKLPEDDKRKRHLAYRIPQALTDILAAYPEAFVFGEDVAKKGGVYNRDQGPARALPRRTRVQHDPRRDDDPRPRAGHGAGRVPADP